MVRLYDARENIIPTADERQALTQLQHAEQVLSEAVLAVTPDADEHLWHQVGSGGARSMDASSNQSLRENAVAASLRSPLMIGYLNSLLRFVVGQGPAFSPTTEDEAQAQAIDDWWTHFCRINMWNELEDEIPWRTWRDGEVFVRRFVSETDAPVPVQFPVRIADLLRKKGLDPDEMMLPACPAGMIQYRIIDADDIADPTGTISDGILTAPGDVRTVLAYCISRGASISEIVPASEIMHIKIRSDSDQKRGRSILEPLLATNTNYEDWLKYRIVLSKVRTAIALWKKVSGNATQVQSIRDQEATTRNNSTLRGESRQKALKPGTVLTSNEKIDYEYLSPNLQAADAQHDGREIKLNMAAATGMPEYIFTGDASNANFASTMVAEAPAVKEFQSWQDFFTPYFKRIWCEVVMAAAERGQIPVSPDDIDADSVEIVWPELLARNELDHARANQIRREAGVLSRKTWQRQDGLDPDVEAERLRSEREEDLEFTVDPGLMAAMNGDGDGT